MKLRLVLAPVIALLLHATSGFAQTCTINFDGVCPNSSSLCGATFSGGLGCVVAGLPFCYDTGSRAYRANGGNPVTAAVPNGISAIVVFFAHTGSASGTMRFFDAVSGGNMVGTPITTNGNCGAAMPPRQSRTFSSAVRRIEVSVSGSGDVWIDSMSLTDARVPVAENTWTLVKKLYR